MTREAWDKRHARLYFHFRDAVGLSDVKALVAANRQMLREKGPRPPAADTGKRPGLLSLAWGMLVHREETMKQITKPLKQAGVAVAAGIVTAVAAYFTSPDFAAAVKEIPLADMWQPIIGTAIAGALYNVLRHLDKYKSQA